MVVDEDKTEHIYKTITLLSPRGGVYLQVKEQLVNGPMKLFRYVTTGSAPAPGFGGFGGLEDQKEKILHLSSICRTSAPFAGPKGENLQNKNKKKIY